MGSSNVVRTIADHGGFDHQPYLATHKAITACTREISVLVKEVVRGVEAGHAKGLTGKPEIRQSPDRCIVQLGPVALTIAWLRSTLDSVADGELLVIVWRGAVAPARELTPERAQATRAQSATQLWEQVLTPAAESADEWSWRAASGDLPAFSSSNLARTCVDELHAAYTAATAN